MVYKQFQNESLSALGLGCMRLPCPGEDRSIIDEEQVTEMVDYALKNGINYFDTAWFYHSGNSEKVIGKILSRYPRDSYYLADKFPLGFPGAAARKEEIFEAQLEKCCTDHFDFYLFHNVDDKLVEVALDPRYGLIDYFREQKANGRIRHLGLSSHGNYETLKRFLDAMDGEIEFCQLQLNWLDWELQDAHSRVALLNERNIPIWVMEPLRGGRLVNLKPGEEKKLREIRPDARNHELAFRFVQSIPGVTMILSGMSNMAQLRDNVSIFSEAAPLSDSEKQAMIETARTMTGAVLCTGCRYCTERCPKGLNIPNIISIYNEHNYAPRNLGEKINDLPEGKRPSDCLGCRACEAICPQKIGISGIMAKFESLLEEDAKRPHPHH